MPSRLAGIAVVATAILALLLVSDALAAAPANDAREHATVVSGLPARETGTTAEATVEPFEPPSACGTTAGSVWYSIAPATKQRRVVAQLAAGGHLDAIVDVFRARRSRLTGVTCDASDSKGHGSLGFAAASGVRYLIRVAQRPESASDRFRLRILQAKPPARAPGRLLPHRGARGRLNRILHSSAAWHVHLRAGTSYRVKLSPLRKACMSLGMYGPGGAGAFRNLTPVRAEKCGGYFVFTPGPGRAGRYVFRVGSDRSFRSFQPYRLTVAAARRDDLAPGLPLSNHATARGRLDGRRVDVYDLYRFDVTRRSALGLHLAARGRAAAFDVLVLDDRGHQLACACQARRTGARSVFQHLPRGRYYAVVRAVGLAHGRYALHRSTRKITSATATINGHRHAHASPGRTVTIAVHVSKGASGPVRIRIERFDPIQGWQFHRLAKVRARRGVALEAFRPPTNGRWRAHAEFLGSRNAAPSTTGFATVLVAGPLVQ